MSLIEVSAIAASVGAYVGSLIGAMHRTRGAGKRVRDAHMHHETRDSGVLLAAGESQPLAAQTLREAGGAAIEHASGRWQHGRWADFDPTRAPVELDERRA